MKQKTSLALSSILVKVFFLVLVSAQFIIPYIAFWYDSLSDRKPVAPFMMTALYLCSICGFAVLVNLHLLLGNLRKAQVFVENNVNRLKWISYSMFVIAVVLALFGILRKLSIAFALVFVLLGVVMRVLQNVFEEAVALQNEQDYTI